MASPAPSSPAAPVRVDAATDELATVLLAALRALGDAGEPETANRLAGRAWAALRRDHPAAARRVNALMHRLTRQETAVPTREEQAMSTSDVELDVRSELPAQRHELIFDTYEHLAPGESFVLVNDHDPKPLYYQFAAEQPNQFSWEYLEQGPEVWRVRIGRTG